MELQESIVHMCRTSSEHLYLKVVTNAHLGLKEVLRQHGGHFEHNSAL
jgi:hypothetical protein